MRIQQFSSKLFGLHCKSCHLEKHVRNHFPDQVNKRASTPFVLVHYDVWGLSLHTSTLESKYFVTFIDDFPRLNILKHKVLNRETKDK